MDVMDWYTFTVYLSLVKSHKKYPLMVYKIVEYISYFIMTNTRRTINCSNDENKLMMLDCSTKEDT